MVDLHGNRTLVVYLRGFLAVLGLLALLGPSFGPLVDHHFAELQYDHVHIYLTYHHTHHTHIYNEPHTHHPSEISVFPLAPVETVFLTSTDAAAPVVTSTGAVPTDADLTFPIDGDAGSLLRTFDSKDFLVENIVIPPRKPPRA